jgi:hypothetical protein
MQNSNLGKTRSPKLKMRSVPAEGKVACWVSNRGDFGSDAVLSDNVLLGDKTDVEQTPSLVAGAQIVHFRQGQAPPFEPQLQLVLNGRRAVEMNDDVDTGIRTGGSVFRGRFLSCSV